MDIFPAVQVVGESPHLGLDVSTRYGGDFQAALEKYKSGFVQVILKTPEKPATEKQNRMFHGLLGLWWKSRLSGFESYDDMRNTIKHRYGVAHAYAIMEDGSYRIVKGTGPCPTDAAETGKILVSWADYKLKDRMRAIDGLISEMEESGILSLDSKYRGEYIEIINGVERV